MFISLHFNKMWPLSSRPYFRRQKWHPRNGLDKSQFNSRLEKLMPALLAECPSAVCFGNLGAPRRTEIKIQEEAGCQSLSVEVHADTCGRDPNVLKPLQWCSLGSSERFVFISSCKCLLTGRSCCTIMIQCRAAETLCARGCIQTAKVPLSGLCQVDPVCL